jgi:thiamine transport system substrate-binding protein
VVFSEGERTNRADGDARQLHRAGRVRRGAARTEQPELAAELVEFMVSDAWQRELPLTNFDFPVTDVELPVEFQQWAPRAEDPMGLAPERIDEGRDRWIEAWREQME